MFPEVPVVGGGLMAEGGDPEYPDVVLGLGAAWGFARADQAPSPALAGAAGALIDTAMTDQPVTELRIHGVSGSDGPTILEHPQTLQVAGDGTAGFFRRWSPDGRDSRAFRGSWRPIPGEG